ncbi:MBL fold metallo-hydrolase [Chakrabartyella piscis]|uniref:MBL fold metallo-hydrolase n=1 Tax=Chakrabartyella piscis TaxID=2918914 RepID=UPI0029583FF7|nr:MBL fold metallo-hydrolase [Chakrabartyella piscis]
MKTISLPTTGTLTTVPHKAPCLYQSEADFSVILVGTGCPMTVLGRNYPCTLVRYKSHYFMVDVGDGTAMRLAEGGIPVGDIESIFFTHHHADHNGGFPYMLINGWMNGRKKLNLVGPPKTKGYYDFLLKLYEDDIDYRSMGRPEFRAYIHQSSVREIEDKETFVLNDVTISTAKLTHSAHNLGYRFEVNGETIVVSGDTSYDLALVELARDADILVMDSGPFPGKEPICASTPYAQGSTPIHKGVPNFQRMGMGKPRVMPHALPKDVARIAKEANVKTIVLTHMIPNIIDEEASLSIFRQNGYEGNVVFGRDLLEIIP